MLTMVEHYSGQMVPARGNRPKVIKGIRICAEEGCNTVLSRYNDTAYCAQHHNPRKARKELLDAKDLER